MQLRWKRKIVCSNSKLCKKSPTTKISKLDNLFSKLFRGRQSTQRHPVSRSMWIWLMGWASGAARDNHFVHRQTGASAPEFLVTPLPLHISNQTVPKKNVNFYKFWWGNEELSLLKWCSNLYSALCTPTLGLWVKANTFFLGKSGLNN